MNEWKISGFYTELNLVCANSPEHQVQLVKDDDLAKNLQRNMLMLSELICIKVIFYISIKQLSLIHI